MSEARPQRKRRQNVACDSCKLRRVKCDLAALLIPAGEEDEADGEDNPPSLLKELVQQHPEVVCTPCRNKRIPCTTESIRNPVKPKKGGKRITLARQLFGKDADAEGSSEDWDTSEHGAGPSRTSDPQFPASVGEMSIFPHQAFETQSTSSQQMDLKSGYGKPSASPTPTPYDGVEFEGYQDEQDAFRIWRDASANLVTVTAKAPPLPILPSPAKEDFGVAHGGTEQVTVDIEPTMNWIKGRPLYSTSIGGRADKVLPYFGTVGTIRPAGTGWTGVTGARGQLENPISSEAGPSSRKRRMGDDGRVAFLAGERDQWHMWSDTNEIFSWGRREQVQEKLADRALGQALSRHLVTVYFNVVHLAFPAVSPEAFYVEWLRAGQDSERMSPSQEALCAVIEAWGARFSDSPVVLGLSGSKAADAPKVWKKDGTTIPGTAARVHWGRSRLSACNALADRAKKLIDYNGIMRRPTVTGIQALALYNLLATMTDQADRAADQYMQAVMTHSAVVEGMRMLQLMWDSDGQMAMDESLLPCENNSLRMKQRRIFWSAMVSDALWAAGAAQMPKIPASDIEAAARWLNVVDRQLPNSSIKVLACFMRFYHRIVWVARDIATNISIPNRRPGTMNVVGFCKTIRRLWAELKTLRRDIVVDCAAIMERCDHALAGVSPLTHLTSLRLSVPFLLLLLHQHVQTQLDFRRTLKSAFIVEDSAQPRPDQVNIAMMEELHLQSVDVVLQSCRGHVPMFKIMLPLGIMQTATSFLRDLIATVLFMAEVPTVEQGYPSQTLGGHGWTWATKQEEVAVCVEAMNQLGWAWSDIGDVLTAVSLTMERMTPSQDVLDAYHQSPRPETQLIDARLREEAMEDIRVMDQALVFWPPDSVPQLVERAMEGIDVQNAEPVELARRLAPDSIYARSIARDRRPHRRLNASSLSSLYAGGSTMSNTPSVGQPNGAPSGSHLSSSSVSPFQPTELRYNDHANLLPLSETSGWNTPESVLSAPSQASRPNTSSGSQLNIDSNLWQNFAIPINGNAQFQSSTNSSTVNDPQGFSTPFDYLFNSSPSKLFSGNVDIFDGVPAHTQPRAPLFPPMPSVPGPSGYSHSGPTFSLGDGPPSQPVPSYNPNFHVAETNPQPQAQPVPSLWGFDFPLTQHMPQGAYLSEQSAPPSMSQTPFDGTASGSQSAAGSRSGSNEPVPPPMSGQATSWQQGVQMPGPNAIGSNVPFEEKTLGEQDYAELQQFLHDLDNIALPGQPGSVSS